MGSHGLLYPINCYIQILTEIVKSIHRDQLISESVDSAQAKPYNIVVLSNIPCTIRCVLQRQCVYADISHGNYNVRDECAGITSTVLSNTT